MDKFEVRKTEIDLEFRSIQEGIKSGTIKTEDAKKQFEEVKLRKSELEKEMALASAPIKSADGSTWKRALEDIRQQRAVTMNGTESVKQVQDIVTLAGKNTPLLNLIRYEYGKYASTKIPVLAPGLAKPATALEGHTSGSTDSTAGLSVVEIVPTSYVSTLPVSWETFELGFSNFESKLPELFAEVYSVTLNDIAVAALFATGGVATANKIECAAAGLPTIEDAMKIAQKIKAKKFPNKAIVTSVEAVTSILSSATDTVGKLYVEEMVRNGTLMGIPIFTDDEVPTAVTTGSTLLVGGDMKNLAAGVATELKIMPKDKVGDGNIYFDALMAFGVKVLQPGNFYALKAK